MTPTYRLLLVSRRLRSNAQVGNADTSRHDGG